MSVHDFWEMVGEPDPIHTFLEDGKLGVPLCLQTTYCTDDPRGLAEWLFLIKDFTDCIDRDDPFFLMVVEAVLPVHLLISRLQEEGVEDPWSEVAARWSEFHAAMRKASETIRAYEDGEAS